MIELSYDLHVHSCLSPCGDDESTPANIAMLSQLLGLDVVAITDHSSCKNCPAFFEAAEAVGIVPIAGMELTTEEEIHVLCLFPELSAAMEFDAEVHEALFPIKNDPEIYGNQLIVNSDDEVIGKEEICLINATSIGIYDLNAKVRALGGIIIPAHIDRSAFSIISSLGTLPDDCGFNCVEIKYPEAENNLKEKYPYISKCNVIYDSDAHRLENLSLGNHKLLAEEKTAQAVLKALDVKI